jgi:hypothetical protein
MLPAIAGFKYKPASASHADREGDPACSGIKRRNTLSISSPAVAG